MRSACEIRFGSLRYVHTDGDQKFKIPGYSIYEREQYTTRRGVFLGGVGVKVSLGVKGEFEWGEEKWLCLAIFSFVCYI